MGAGVGAAGVGELLDEPQAFLLEGEGDGLCAVGGGDGGGGCGGGGGVDRGGSASMVVWSKRVRSGRGRARVASSRAARRSAMSEWPPRAKKSSARPTSGRPRRSAMAVATAASVGVRGAIWAGRARAASPARAGSARRSSLPLTVIGRRRRPAKSCGVMCSGRTARALARSAARSRCGARSKGAPSWSVPPASMPSGTRKACSTPSG